MSSMKLKTSITISGDLIESIDRLSGSQKNRSEFIERAVREYIDREAKRRRDQEDLALINRNADRLNREAEDVLSYQTEI